MEMTIEELIGFLKEKRIVEDYISLSTCDREVRFADGETITFDSPATVKIYLKGMVKAFQILSAK